jgi:hypothetical protein
LEEVNSISRTFKTREARRFRDGIFYLHEQEKTTTIRFYLMQEQSAAYLKEIKIIAIN